MLPLRLHHSTAKPSLSTMLTGGSKPFLYRFQSASHRRKDFIMRMKKNLILLFFLAFISFSAFIIFKNASSPTIHSGSTLPSGDFGIRYIDYRSSVTGKNTVCLTFYRNDPQEGMAFLLENISSFTLSGKNGTIYQCSERDLSRSAYVIPLDADLWENGCLTLTLKTPYLRRLTSLAIGSPSTLFAREQMHDIISLVCIFLQLMLILICITLYLAKPTERYLFSLSLLILASLLTRIISNELVNYFFSHALNKILLPVLGLFPIWPESFLFLKLSQANLPAPFDRFIKLRSFTVLTIITCLLAYLRPDSSTEFMLICVSCIFLLTSFILYKASLPFVKSNYLLVGAFAADLGILWGNSFVNLFARVRTLACFSPSTIAFLIYSLGTCLFVFLRFAQKFKEAEILGQELEDLNHQLDEKAAQKAQELVEEKAQKHRLMLNVFHDLRSPLYIAGECVSALRENRDTTDYLEILEDRLDFMNRLTEDLFLIAKMEDHDFLMVMDRVNLSVLCAEQCQAAAVLAKNHHIQFNTHILPDFIIWGDSYRLEQTIQNLLSNALTYTPAGGTVSVSLERAISHEEEDSCVLSVSDTGKGISAENLPFIFERYYRVDRAENSKSTGLGLSIAYEIVKAHKGFLTVDSTPGKGTCFRAVFPLLSEHVPQINGQENSAG